MSVGCCSGALWLTERLMNNMWTGSFTPETTTASTDTDRTGPEPDRRDLSLQEDVTELRIIDQRTNTHLNIDIKVLKILWYLILSSSQNIWKYQDLYGVKIWQCYNTYIYYIHIYTIRTFIWLNITLRIFSRCFYHKRDAKQTCYVRRDFIPWKLLFFI